MRTNLLNSRIRRLFAGVTLTALAIAAPLGAHAATSTIFDTFDVNEGHFNQSPTYSPPVGIATSSTAVRVTTSPIEGAGCEKLVLYTNGATASVRCRFLSGTGVAGNNTPFTTSSATDGWIGCFLKTTNTGWNVQLWIEGPSNNGGVPKDIIADGEWHVYEWNLDDNSGGADGWGSISGIASGSATVSDGSHTIDSVIFRNPNVPDGTIELYMDFVARYSDGTISNLVSQPCLGTPGVGLNGPLSTNENIVRVTGVSSSATAITVYQGPNPSGFFTNLHSIMVSSPAAAVNVTVPTGKLVKGAKVWATQTIAGQESCVPTTGVSVGGGASPKVKIAASIAQPGGVAGPVGRDGGGSANMYWLHATGSAVAGGYAISPSTNWQTIAFYPTDNKRTWNGTFVFPDENQYGVFEGFAIAGNDAADSGPIQIYFDNLRQVTNGTEALIQDFEGNANGLNTVQFRQPSYASTTSGGILSPDPNKAIISSTLAGGYASTGTGSLGVNFQFMNAGTGPWLRLVSSGPNGSPATPNPVVDLTQPILVDVLLLPVGQTVAHPLGEINPLDAFSQTNCPGSSVTFTVAATPPTGTSPTYAYVWKRNGTAISGATGSVYTKSGVSSADAGTYSVTVSDGVASATVTDTILTVPTAVQIDSQPPDGGVQANGTGYGYLSASVSIPETCPCANDPNIGYRWQFNGVALSDGGNISGATGTGTGTAFPALTIYPTYYSNAGSYTLVITNTCTGQTVTSAVAKLWVTPNPEIAGTCYNGLLGLYFTNQTYLVNPFTDPPAWTNVEYMPIDFDWSTNSFNQGVFPLATDYFMVRWVGTLQAPYDPGSGQSYTFYVRSDDGARLWVDGNLVVDSWITQGATTRSGSVVLTTNAPVQIILEYFEQTGNASVQLAYESLSMPSNILSSAQMCAADPNTAIPPRINLTSPVNNLTNIVGTQVSLNATVTQESTTVNSVKFYNNATNLLATLAAPGPYSTTWTPPATGVYNITAQVAYSTTNKLNSPVSKLTVINVPVAACTISNIIGTTLTYGGGTGTKFILLESSDVAASLSTWTRAHTNNATPGSFTISTGGAQKFYRIKSE